MSICFHQLFIISTIIYRRLCSTWSEVIRTTEPVLIEAMGDSVNLRILNFFIENPFDMYSIYQISKLVDVSRNSVYKYLPEFEGKDYLIREKNGSRDVYRLNRNNRIIELIDRFIDAAGNVYLRPLKEPLGQMGISQMQMEQLCHVKQPSGSAAA